MANRLQRQIWHVFDDHGSDSQLDRDCTGNSGGDSDADDSISSVCFLSFVRMPQMNLHYVLDNSISCHNVTSLFPFSPHSGEDL